jgi:hypothetical protein
MQEVKTIHEHYARQATPEVWAEVDGLRAALAQIAIVASENHGGHKRCTLQLAAISRFAASVVAGHSR